MLAPLQVFGDFTNHPGVQAKAGKTPPHMEESILRQETQKRPQRDSNPRRRRERPVSWAWLDDGDFFGNCQKEK